MISAQHVPFPTRNARGVVTVIVFAALSACSLAPTYERPELSTASMYPTTAAAGASAGLQAPLPLWPDFFGDADLKHLIGRALDNNRDLRIALYRVGEARALYGIQRAEQFPATSAQALGSRARVPADLSLTGQPVISSEYQVTFGVSAWELDLWGRVRNLKEAALQSYFASEEARRAVELTLIAQVANSYLLGRELDERIGLAERTVKTREESLRIARRRYEVGSAGRLDAVQAETLLNQARSELTILLRLRDLNSNALTLLVGEPIAFQARTLTAVEPDFLPAVSPGLPSDLLMNRPDVLAAERRLKAASANIGAARAAFFPRISLTAGVGTASSELNNLFGAGSGVWSLTPSLVQPLFDGGRNRATLELSEARKESAVADYERTVQAAFRDVANALVERQWLGEQVRAQQATLAAQNERARLANLRYRNGAAPYLEVLDAERDRFNVEQALVQTRRALLASGVDLYAALGGASLR